MTGRDAPAGSPLRLATSRPSPQVCLVTAAGELDMSTVPLLRAHLRQHTATRPAHLVLDLTAVTLIAAAGITLVVDALRNDHGIHGRLRVVAPPGSPALRVLQLTGVHALLGVHDDLDGALAAAAD